MRKLIICDKNKELIKAVKEYLNKTNTQNAYIALQDFLNQHLDFEFEQPTKICAVCNSPVSTLNGDGICGRCL